MTTTLPAFPDFRPVCLSDRGLITAALHGLQPETSELSFTNLFMFRHVHDYQFSTLNGSVLVLAKSYAGEAYFIPPIGGTDPAFAVEAMMEYLRIRGRRPVMEIAPKGFVDEVVAPSGLYEFAPDPDNADYIYSTRELITLSGRKFHDKKNLLNRFVKTHPHEYRPLTKDLIPQARDLVTRWCQEKCSLEIPSTYGETEATMLALDNIETLGIRGGVVVINGKVEALALGEELNRETVVVHVEKANSDYSGLYQYISSEFLAREFAGYPFVNREQDLGEPNLRKSKLSYNPVRMVEKYRVWPKG